MNTDLEKRGSLTSGHSHSKRVSRRTLIFKRKNALWKIHNDKARQTLPHLCFLLMWECFCGWMRTLDAQTASSLRKIPHQLFSHIQYMFSLCREHYSNSLCLFSSSILQHLLHPEPSEGVMSPFTSHFLLLTKQLPVWIFKIYLDILNFSSCLFSPYQAHVSLGKRHPFNDTAHFSVTWKWIVI